MKSKNIFYVDSTIEFKDLCMCYSMCGSFRPPPQYAQLLDKLKQKRKRAMTRNTKRCESDSDKKRQNSSLSVVDDDGAPPLVPFVNLMEQTDTPSDGDGNDDDDSHADAWMNNAIRLHRNIQDISNLLREHSESYTHRHIFDIYSTPPMMKEDEEVMFESSIASFLATTAGQMDTLRQALFDHNSRGPSEQIQTHKSGILTHLVACLTNITEEFKSMQSIRNRQELEMFLDPYKFCYQDPDVMEMESSDNMAMADLGASCGILEVSEAFIEIVEQEEEDFQHMYNHHDDDEEDELERILVEETLFSFPQYHNDGALQENNKENTRGAIFASRSSTTTSTPSEMKRTTASQQVPLQPQHQNQKQHQLHPPKPMMPTTFQTNQPMEDHQNNDNIMGYSTTRPTTNDILQQEQVFLTNTLQNTKLDSVQGVESQMMQITSLLSQFSTLVSEQQEEVQVIAEASAKSRQNVDSGREQLVQATEQKKKGRHYFAWIIFSMGLFLLFLNAVTP